MEIPNVPDNGYVRFHLELVYEPMENDVVNSGVFMVVLDTSSNPISCTPLLVYHSRLQGYMVCSYHVPNLVKEHSIVRSMVSITMDKLDDRSFVVHVNVVNNLLLIDVCHVLQKAISYFHVVLRMPSTS